MVKFSTMTLILAMSVGMDAPPPEGLRVFCDPVPAIDYGLDCEWHEASIDISWIEDELVSYRDAEDTDDE